MKPKKTAPPAKRTGKAGIGPAEDDEPMTKPGSPAATGKVTPFKAEEEAEEEQQELGIETEEAEAPHQAEVENGMVLMQFVRVKPTREKGGKRFQNIELSVGLTPESAQLFGRDVEGRYDILTDDPSITSLTVSDAAPHTIDVALASSAKPAVHAIAQLARVSLAAVQQKGSGEEQTVIRFSFVAIIPQTDELTVWAANHHGELVWVRMAETQGRLV